MMIYRLLAKKKLDSGVKMQFNLLSTKARSEIDNTRKQQVKQGVLTGFTVGIVIILLMWSVLEGLY